MRAGIIRTAVGRAAISRMPWHLLLAAVALTFVGVAFIYSAASLGMALRHMVFAGLGLVAFVVFSLLDYRHLRGLAPVLYAAGVLSLAGLFALGTTINYAQRWYNVGFFHVQPSELMKYVLVIVLADYLRSRKRMDRLRDLAMPAALTGLPVLLIMGQPDLGSALILGALFFAMTFLGGVPVRNLALVVGLGVALLAAAWFIPGVLKDYQRMRLETFLNPAATRDSSAAYNAEQAITAVAAGGMHGQGYGRGVLNRLGRIPESYADFMFPVIAEEWGFVRTAPFACVYLFLAFLLARIACKTRDPFGRLLVGGVLSLLALQSFLHMAIALRLAPITGLPLPLVGYGGSSLLSTFAGLGLVGSVCTHTHVLFEPGAEEEA
ncbi:MAG: rod shape-determining protein RodA [Candidatus Brocadiaceae bacterium]|nr:rod shape-determining protein RodA [Candidatus Brocadiaceae bacterium]